MSDVELVRETHPQAGENTFKSIEEATAFLKEAARSKTNLKNFQSAWEEVSPKRKEGTPQQERTRMFRGLADRLLAGSLRVRIQHHAVSSDTSAAETETAAREPKQTWSGGTRLKVRDRPDPAPPPPPEPPMNVQQQVEALKAAAESGAPFCERCQDPPQ